MVRAFVVFCAALFVLVTFEVSARRHAGAGDVLQRVLHVAAGQQRVGAYTWLEDRGMAVKLAPAVPRQSWPRLLAGDAPDRGPVATGLWELGETGFRGLRETLEQQGAVFEASAAFRFAPRAYGEDVNASWTVVRLAGGRAGGVADFSVNDRKFAFVFAAEAGADARLLAHRDAVLAETVMLPGAVAGAVCPLLVEGRFAFVLPGWRRVGERFYSTVAGSWLGLRIFQVSEVDFPSLGALRNELEAQLSNAGFRAAVGEPAAVPGGSGFVREYYRDDDGYVQRVLYAKLASVYLVALMQAPTAQRDQLQARAAQFIASITPVEIGGQPVVHLPYFTEVRHVRCVAWQSGRQLVWGALFDDVRHAAVTWRQDDVEWHVAALRDGEVIAEKSGVTNSSRTLNPLVNADGRALALNGDWTGTLEVELKVGTHTARATVNVR